MNPKTSWIQILTLLLASRIILDKILNLSVPQFLRLWIEDNNSTYFVVLVWEVNELMFAWHIVNTQ